MALGDLRLSPVEQLLSWMTRIVVATSLDGKLHRLQYASSSVAVLLVTGCHHGEQ